MLHPSRIRGSKGRPFANSVFSLSIRNLGRAVFRDRGQIIRAQVGPTDNSMERVPVESEILDESEFALMKSQSSRRSTLDTT